MLRLSEDFICRKICGETLVMPVGEKTKEYNGIFTLTETGAFLLDAIAEGADEETAAARLAESFEISVADARQDTAEFLAQLRGYGILLE
ncbi:MAG: PqqD family protein [Clostridia bacterium]|nr:PqqD family protein [Clostridia bacterium]